MKRRLFLITIISIVICILFFICAGLIEDSFNLVFRDWTFLLATILLGLSGLIIEIIIFTRLNNLFEKKISISKIWKDLIRVAIIIPLILGNLYILFFTVFLAAFGYVEIGTDMYDGKKYVVTDTGWMTPDHSYTYYPYKNLFLYHADGIYTGEKMLDEYSNHEDDGDGDTIPGNYTPYEITIEDLNIDPLDQTTVQNLEIDPLYVELIQEIDDNLSYGFYLVDKAMSAHFYAFIQSEDGGLTWKGVSLFSDTGGIYYSKFLDQNYGFVNFGPREGLSLFMTKDGGLSWDPISMDIPEQNKDMIYVRNIEKDGERIEISLGYPSWVDSDRQIKYYSTDNGVSWHLQKE